MAEDIIETIIWDPYKLQAVIDEKSKRRKDVLFDLNDKLSKFRDQLSRLGITLEWLGEIAELHAALDDEGRDLLPHKLRTNLDHLYLIRNNINAAINIREGNSLGLEVGISYLEPFISAK